MIPMTLGDLAEAVGGRLAGGVAAQDVVSGPVVIDSREAGPGSLFVALPGERVDGHRFAGSAHRAGAVAVLAAHAVDAPCVVVEDPVLALGRLARAVRDRLPGLQAIGITGSSGKTSTKDLLAQVLPGLGPTVAPQDSFNNEIGVPLTVLRCEDSSRYLVSEMGARAIGNIRYLCDIVAPRVAVVLNVGMAHAGEFGGREATAAAKGELVEALPADGLAVLNADDDLVAAMAARTTARTTFVGRSAGAEVQARDVRLDGVARATFTLVSALPGRSGQVEVVLPVHGEHHVANALAAAAVALDAGMDLPVLGQALSQAGVGSAGRMQVSVRRDHVVVIDDSYNANPDSVTAALHALVRTEPQTPVETPVGRRWAVLGEMLELGEDSDAEHERIGALAVRLGVDRVLSVGAGGAGYRAPVQARDVSEALAILHNELRPGDVVLVKASRAVGLDAVARGLLESGVASGQDVAAARPGPGAGPDIESGEVLA